MPPEGPAPTGAPAAPATPAAPAATPAPTEPIAPGSTQGAPEVDLEALLNGDLPAQDTFPRHVVEKLREEAKTRRLENKPWKEFHEEFKDHFEGPEQIREFLDIFRSPEKFTGWFAQMAREFPPEVLREMVGELIENAPTKQQMEQELDRPMTRREFQELQQRQQQAVRMAREDQEVERTLTKLKVPDEDREYVIRFAQSERARNPRLSYSEALNKGLDSFKKKLDSHAASVADKEKASKDRTPGSIGGAPPVVDDEEQPPEGVDPWRWARQRAKARVQQAAKGKTLS